MLTAQREGIPAMGVLGPANGARLIDDAVCSLRIMFRFFLGSRFSILAQS